MTKMKIKNIAMIGMMSIVFGAAPVLAQPGGYFLYEYSYYSDASHTHLVGILTEHCYEPATLSGEVTPYYTRIQSGYYSYSGGCDEY